MRLFPPINRTTLDSFHRDVYRPRLSLLLLILLLILGQQHQHEQSQNRQINHSNLSTAKAIRDNNGNLKVTQYSESDGGLIKQLTPLLNQLPDRIRLDKSPIAIRWVKKAGELTWKGTSQEVQKSTEAISLDKTQAEQIKKSLRNKLATGKRSNKSTFSSPLRRTKGGKKKEQSYGSLLAKVLNADALSALISLHLLWAIRLGSMLLEDRLGKENSTTSSSNLSLSQSYIWLIVSAFLALLSSFFSWSTVFQRWGIIRPPTHTTPAIAIQILTILELSATFVSFLPPLFRIRASPLAQFIPRKISLPSPSHSPSLLELLPIPAGLIEALKAPREDTTMYSRRRTTNQWHGGGRHMIAAPLPGINAGDLTGAAANAANADQSSRSNRIRNGLAEPLRMPRTNAGKAPRMKGMRVSVDSTWLLENVVILYGHAIGAIQYIVVIASLPTFAPTSFPSLLSLLSLRSALGSVITTWSSARRSVECLEFVQRRWSQQQTPPPPPPPPSQSQSSSLNSSICSMCFEIVDDTDDPEDCCTLDCGHQLHSVCLVQWLTKQAFCPCCHSTLKATPPSMRATTETTAPVT